MSMRQILSICTLIAWSEFKECDKKTFKHWSFIIDNRRRLVGWATNKPKFPETLKKIGFKWFRHTLHAEVAAYGKCCSKRGFDRRKPWSIVNIRILSNGMLGMSAPCAICANFLKAVGCEYCWYSTDDQNFIKARLDRYLDNPNKYVERTSMVHANTMRIADQKMIGYVTVNDKPHFTR